MEAFIHSYSGLGWGQYNLVSINSRDEFNLRICFVIDINIVSQMLDSIRDCFVTGKWEDDQDAATLLKEDGKELVLIAQYCRDCFHDFLGLVLF